MILLPHSYVKRLPATKLGGGGMLVYAPVVKRAIEENMFVTFFTDVDNASMQNIINRRFKECIIQKIISSFSEKRESYYHSLVCY